MLPKPKFLKTSFIVNKIKLFFSLINPRYQLSFDDDYFDIKEKTRKYRFKSFGDHSFPEFTFNEIKQNINVLYAINPHDLMKITEKNYIEELSTNQFKIMEIMRNNFYKLSNAVDSNTFSGDEICDNPLLFDQIAKSDLFKIAYNTGFDRGRKLSKMIIQENHHTNFENNVVTLKCFINKNEGLQPLIL